MDVIRTRVDEVRARQQKQWMWLCLSRGLLGGGVAGCLLGLARLFSTDAVSLWVIAVAVLGGPLAGYLVAVLRPRGPREAAVLIDRSYQLKERIATALGFLSSADKTPLRSLQIADATEHARGIDPHKVAPIRAPQSWVWGLMLSTAAVLLAIASTPTQVVQASVVPNEVIVSQADRLERELEQLQEFSDEQADEEVQQLLKELAEKIEELKQPGVDPKEALAKLSEMEASLQAKQKQLADPHVEAALAEVGKALALAEPFQAAGDAMSQGNMEKAAEELEKLELPKLERKTERAITDKLEQQARQNQGQGAQRTLREALGQVSQGLTQGDRSRFKDGMKGLAGECKNQGRRKKLMDLLRKQCQCLSECKGECEGQCKNNAMSNKKGGKNWGLASSGNEPGDKTPLLKSKDQMKITGQESNSGEVDTETMNSPEQEQEAVRQYREQAAKYEQLSESVLESEPIPLGHRQAIRRYFEMIRPAAEAVIPEKP